MKTILANNLKENEFGILNDTVGHKGRLVQLQKKGNRLVLLSNGSTEIGDYFSGVKFLKVKPITKSAAFAKIGSMIASDMKAALTHITPPIFS